MHDGHDHDHLGHPGRFDERGAPLARDYGTRAFTVGIGGPGGSGKTALVLALCRELRDRVTGEIKVPQDYSEVGALMIAATLITLLVPLVTVAGVRLLRLRTA